MTWEGARRFAKDMTVAAVVGHSMEPGIPDGAYCLFRRVSLPSSPERAVLVRHDGAANPETGGHYTVKRYRQGMGPNGEKQVVLEPANAAFAPMVITLTGVDDVQVLAEVVQVLGMPDDTLDGVSTRTLEGVLLALSQGREIAATDALIEHLDDLFLAGEFAVARRLLVQLNPQRLPPKVLSGVLMVTRAAKATLGEERTSFLERVRTVRATRDRERPNRRNVNTWNGPTWTHGTVQRGHLDRPTWTLFHRGNRRRGMVLWPRPRKEARWPRRDYLCARQRKY